MTEFDKNKYSEYEELLKGISPEPGRTEATDDDHSAEFESPDTASSDAARETPEVSSASAADAAQAQTDLYSAEASAGDQRQSVRQAADVGSRAMPFNSEEVLPEQTDTNVMRREQPDAATTLNKKPNRVTGVFEWMESAVFAVVVVILLFTFIFRIVGIDGESMLPTLHNKDRVIITDLFFTPETGDIVVLDMGNNDVVLNGRPYSKPLIKRVIATGGQTVEVVNEDGEQCVYVDGVKLDEDYINFATVVKSSEQEKITVPEGQVFVMGDNRGESLDSRIFGCVDERSIVGHAIFRIYPVTDIGLLNN